MKDTLQLAAFNDQNFSLGLAAMNVNENLPNFIVEKIKKTRMIEQTCVGILGMTFKANIDDTRDSLSFKLAKLIRFYGEK